MDLDLDLRLVLDLCLDLVLDLGLTGRASVSIGLTRRASVRPLNDPDDTRAWANGCDVCYACALVGTLLILERDLKRYEPNMKEYINKKNIIIKITMTINIIMFSLIGNAIIININIFFFNKS